MTIEYTPEHEVVGTLNETPPEPVKKKRTSSKRTTKKRTRKGKSKK